MNSPARAIAWEIWRKNRLGNLLCLGWITAFAIEAIAWATWQRSNRSEPAETDVFMGFVIPSMLATVIWILNVFAHSDRDARTGFSGVPTRMFTLPVRTSFLVGCLMLYGVVAICACYLAWVELVLRPLGLFAATDWPLLVLAVAMCSFQAAVWGLASFPWIRIWAISLGAVALIFVSAAGYGWPSISWLNRSTVTLLLLAWLPVSYAGAVFGVNAERHGGWHVWVRLQPLIGRIADALPRRRGPFESAAQAQFWFEWRRKGWVLTTALACSIAAGVVLFPYAMVLDDRWPLPVLGFLCMLLLLLFVCAASGAEMAKSEFWAGEAGIRTFHATRPLTDAGLVLAKLKVATAVTLLGWLLAGVLVGTLMYWTRWHHFLIAQLEEKQSMLWSLRAAGSVMLITTLIATILITWHGMVASLDLGLLGRNNMIVIYSLIGAVLLFAAVAGVGWFYSHPTNSPLLLWLFYMGASALALLKIFGMIRTLAEVRRRELLDSHAIRVAFLLWLLMAGCLLAWVGALWFRTPVPRVMLLFMLVWFWPAGELPHCVLHLASNRHR